MIFRKKFSNFFSSAPAGDQKPYLRFVKKYKFPKNDQTPSQIVGIMGMIFRQKISIFCRRHHLGPW